MYVVSMSMRTDLARRIEATVADHPAPTSADDPARQALQIVLDKIASQSGMDIVKSPKLDIYCNPDRSLYWHVGYANGLTFRPHCIAHEGCISDASEMVGGESLCDMHANKRRRENTQARQRAIAWADSPEGRREAAWEQAMEARYS